MKRLGIIVMLLAGGCGVHLGDKYGRRTRAAFDAQIAKGDGGNAISGEDAKLVMAVHEGRGGDNNQSSSSSLAPPGLYVSTGSSSSSGPSMRSPSPDINRLDAVR